VSVTPEFILQTAIVRGINRMRSEYPLIAQLFRNVDQKGVAQISNFIKTQQFDLAINYPRTTLKLPGIVLVLRNEQEQQAFLGDSMGIEIPDIFAYDGIATTGQVQGAASTSSTMGNPKTVFGPMPAFTGTKNTLRVAAMPWAVDAYASVETEIRIIAGTGSGQVRTVAGNSRDTIMTATDWLTIPDSTSQFILTLPPDEIVGEPSALYDRANPPAFIERRGGLYSMTYQAIVATASPEATIYLSAILKGIMMLQRRFLEAQGVINFKIGASDFSNRQEWLPDIAFVRSMNIEFTFPFDIYEPMEEVARSFRLVLEGQAEEGVALPPILSDTSFGPVSPTAPINEPIANPLSDVQRIYFGVATPPGSVNATFVQNTLGTQGTLLASTRQIVINYQTGTGQKLYYSVPSRFNVDFSNFLDAQTNMLVGFSRVAQLSLTTNFGTEPYDVWASDQAYLGFVAVQVR
jgi:hypothetical protein